MISEATGPCPEIVDQYTELTLERMLPGEPLPVDFDDHTLKFNSEEYGLDPSIRVHQILVLPTMDSESAPKAVALVSSMDGNERRQGIVGLSVDETGNYRPPRPGIELETGSAIFIGRGGNEAYQHEKPEDADFFTSNRALYGDDLDRSVSKGQVLIAVTDKGFEITHNGKNDTLRTAVDMANVVTNPRGINMAAITGAAGGKEAEGASVDTEAEYAAEIIVNATVALSQGAAETGTEAEQSPPVEQPVMEGGPSAVWSSLPSEVLEQLPAWGIRVDGVLTPDQAAVMMAEQSALCKSILGQYDSTVEKLQADVMWNIKNSLESKRNLVGENSSRQLADALQALSTRMGQITSGPKTLKNNVEEVRKQLWMTGNALSDLVKTHGRIDDQVGEYALGMLNRTKENVQSVLAKMIRANDDMGTNLLGYGSYTEMTDAKRVSETFALDVAKEWAKDLSGELTDEQLRGVEDRIAFTVRDLLSQQSDRFPARTQDKTLKLRNELALTGRKSGTVDSPTAVTELITDMLRGKFDVEKSNRESIEIVYKDGKTVVETGQHRAAALQILYGDNWMKVAQAKGIRTDTKS